MRGTIEPVCRTASSTYSGQEEVPFGFEEIFFSRTDARGVIEAGNSVFRRVSGYDGPQLIGAPHRIIRHPIMPKAVFRLLWDRLHAGQPTGAYVCNRARDGRPYWVFAIVVPIGDGYLSVRIKPGTPILGRARELYADLLAAEAAGLGPVEAAAELLACLAREGFPSYDSFQAQALAAEVSCRASQSGRPQPELAVAVKAAGSADGIAVDLVAMSGMLRRALRIAMNLRILASHLGQEGRALSAVADTYAHLCTAMTEWVEQRRASGGGFGALALSVNENLFLRNATALLDEMSANFDRDAESGVGDVRAERARLAEAATHYRGRAGECNRLAARHATDLERHLSQMRHHVVGLDAIRMLCRVESDRRREKHGTLDQIVGQLDSFQEELGARLTRMVTLGRDIQRGAMAR